VRPLLYCTSPATSTVKEFSVNTVVNEMCDYSLRPFVFMCLPLQCWLLCVMWCVYSSLRYFCEVSCDKILYAKTSVKSDVLLWNELFEFT